MQADIVLSPCRVAVWPNTRKGQQHWPRTESLRCCTGHAPQACQLPVPVHAACTPCKHACAASALLPVPVSPPCAQAAAEAGQSQGRPGQGCTAWAADNLSRDRLRPRFNSLESQLSRCFSAGVQMVVVREEAKRSRAGRQVPPANTSPSHLRLPGTPRVSPCCNAFSNVATWRLRASRRVGLLPQLPSQQAPAPGLAWTSRAGRRTPEVSQAASSLKTLVPLSGSTARRRRTSSAPCTRCTGTALAHSGTAVVRTLATLLPAHLLSKYKTMELHLLENRKRIQMKLPDLEKSLEVVKMLQAKKVGVAVSPRHTLKRHTLSLAGVAPRRKQQRHCPPGSICQTMCTRRPRWSPTTGCVCGWAPT